MGSEARAHLVGVDNQPLNVVHEIAREPPGPSGGNIATTYTRDVGGRVAGSSTTSGATQARSFGFDNLGLLLWETHPEKTANSAGLGHDVDYPAYNAVGNVLRRVDGTNDLTLVYDEAMRLTLIRETSGGQRALKEFAYAPSNGAGERSLGKLRTATRHNRFNLCGTGGGHDAAIEETYTYAGIGGGVSKRATRLLYDAVAGESFEQTFSWTALGQPNSIGYPRCTTCTGPASVTRNISYGYANGWVTSVPGYANAVTYFDNGLWNQVTRANGVIDTQSIDTTNMMARPLSIGSALGATALWTTGAYAFDGAGNVTRTSAGHYIYDGVSRIKEGQIYLFVGGGSGGTRIQRPTYDAFGNIQSLSLQVDANTPVPRDLATNSATNRLTGGSYDAAGNLTAWNGQAFEYDPFNQVRHVTVPGEDWLHFYTADDERIWSYRLGGAAFNRWTLRDLAGNVLREFVSDAAGWRVERDYIYRDGALLASETPQGVRHMHIDHLGTPRAITDGAGTRLAYHAYLPFGEEGTGFSQDTERAKFTGHERDLNSSTDASDDLDHMHARQYSMLGGRFLSTDWVGGSLRRPQSLNRYAYVMGNPMTYWDPFGLCTPIGGIEIDDCSTTVIGSLRTVPFEPAGGVGGYVDESPLHEPDLSRAEFALAVAADFDGRVGDIERDARRLGNCIVGESDPSGLALVAAGSPLVDKRFISRTTGAVRWPLVSDRTSYASRGLSRLLPMRMGSQLWAPTLAKGLSGSASLGRFLGRWVPYVGVALLAKDAVDVVRCVAEDN